MNKALIRAYFQAYRARITDLEAEVESLSYQLGDSESRCHNLSKRLDSTSRDLNYRLQEEQYDRWRLEDRVHKLERR